MINITKHSGIYTLKVKQNLKMSLDDAWNYFSNPSNLSEITPAKMGFNITSEKSDFMYVGQIISYKVSPLLGLKMNWVTEITHISDKSFFVDEQRFGPYALWHHKHFIRPIEGGVEMEDIVDYKLPFGLLGRLAHPILVKPKLKEIFDYRHKKLIELFGSFKS